MPKMRIHEIRALDDQKLQKELEDSYKELLNLRFRHAAKQLANTAEIRNVRKKMARLKTVIREREIQRSSYGQRETES